MEFAASFEALHAIALMTTMANTQKGGTTFRGSFELKNHTKHAEDMLYFNGLYYLEKFKHTKADYFMDSYYPKFIKQFIFDEKPDKGNN